MKLTTEQQRTLWSLACSMSQSGIVLYDEDHEFDEERDLYLKAVQHILDAEKSA